MFLYLFIVMIYNYFEMIIAIYNIHIVIIIVQSFWNFKIKSMNVQMFLFEPCGCNIWTILKFQQHSAIYHNTIRVMMFMALKTQIKYIQICLKHNINVPMPSNQSNIDIIKKLKKNYIIYSK